MRPGSIRPSRSGEALCLSDRDHRHKASDDVEEVATWREEWKAAARPASSIIHSLTSSHPLPSWPGLTRPSRYERRRALHIGITGTSPVMTGREVMTKEVGSTSWPRTMP
ncbi:hypothetical protein J4G37_06015 [Microvirga sp. 3-52]|nr:hypothetical protein [Microvirga sp. 3-52]